PTAPGVPRAAGQLLAAGCAGTRTPAAPVALAEQSGLGGIVLFTRNCPALETVLSLPAAARRLDPDILVMVDHEGGRVHRLPPPFTRFPPAAAVGRAGEPRLAAAGGGARGRGRSPPGGGSRGSPRPRPPPPPAPPGDGE